MDHALACSVWVALGAATFPLLFFVLRLTASWCAAGGARRRAVEEVEFVTERALAYALGLRGHTLTTGPGPFGDQILHAPQSAAASSSQIRLRVRLRRKSAAFAHQSGGRVQSNVVVNTESRSPMPPEAARESVRAALAKLASQRILAHREEPATRRPDGVETHAG